VIENDDRQGGADISTADLITVWASVLPFDSHLALQYAQLTTQQGYNIECRCLKTLNLTTKNGIKYGDKILTIHSCDPLTDPMKIKLIAFEQ
jgi:hypothetical protein